MKNLVLIILIILHFSLFTFHSFAQSCLPDGFIFTTQEQIDNFQTNNPGCTEIEGDVEINGNDITNLNGLSVLTAFWGNLWIYYNDDLTSLTGLNNVTSVGGTLYIGFHLNLSDISALYDVTTIGGGLSIKDNYALTSLSGLENVQSIGEDLEIENNSVLESLSALNHVSTIGGYIEIYNNDVLMALSSFFSLNSVGQGIAFKNNPSLFSIMDLYNVTSIGTGYYIWIEGNAALVNLTGLDNIEAASLGGLYIYNNMSLSTCEVQSICDYLVSPGGTVTIDNNAPGCDSQEEVEEACGITSLDEINPEDKILIFPNPCSGTAQLQFRINDQQLTILNLYHISGVKIKRLLSEEKMQGEYEMVIDLSDLPAGMYIIEVVSGQKRFREKIMIY